MSSTPGTFASGEFPPQSTEQTWYVRPYQASDESGLIELFVLVFNRSRSVEHLWWKLLAQNTGPAEMVWVAAEKESERIIGHYAGIPLEIQLDGRVVQGIHSVEAMAHPDHRRKGILTALGASAHQEWAHHGYELVIGLPNDKWGTRNVVLGYVQQFPLTWMKFPLRLDRILNRRLKSSVVRLAVSAPAWAASWLWRRMQIFRRPTQETVKVVPVNFIEATSDILTICTKLDKLYLNAVVRSPSWLRWRYGEEPTGTFKVLITKINGVPTGFIAYRLVVSKRRVTGYVADLFVGPGDRPSAFALLTAALDDLDEMGAGSVMAAAPPGSPAYLHLRENGFRSTKAGFTFEIVPLTRSIDPATVRNPSQWHLAAGDFDIV